MSSSWATMDSATLQRVADVLELRANLPAQRSMLESYLSEIPFPAQAQVLEVGCGTGAVARVLATWTGVKEVIGVDPVPLFLAKARSLSGDVSNLSFREADGCNLPFADHSFDLVVFHTALSHISTPERALAEAHRVLRPGGRLAIFDGDYTTVSVAIGDCDPLQTCVDAMRLAYSGDRDDRWYVRRFPSLMEAAGFKVSSFRSHGYVETAAPDYTVTLVDRGVDTLVSVGRIGVELAAALKAEARRRIAEGIFFGQIVYISIAARKPD